VWDALAALATAHDKKTVERLIEAVAVESSSEQRGGCALLKGPF